ncbi:MAG: RsmE family RNA methyltransferase [Desulfomicrobium escambiense]|nr:RsmE family RNA methyltransferase [Desulfomicrobium escambiense]
MSLKPSLKNFSTKTVIIELGKIIPTADKEIKITLAQALPKAGKMDIIVKSAAELGADVIIPFDAARSVGRIADEKSSLKVARWQKIAGEAARCQPQQPYNRSIDSIIFCRHDCLRLQAMP